MVNASKALLFLVKTAFCKNENGHAENLIKPVVYEDFWGPFPEKWPKSIKKALGFSVKRNGFFDVFSAG